MSNGSGGSVDPERFARGLAKYREVYGDDAIALGPGESAFFDLMMAQLFGEIWAREALAIPQRRLLVMGVLAAQAKWDTLQLQLTRALATGELTVDQVREVALHLIQYVGYPSSSDLFRVSETAIALHAQPPTDDEGLE
jgi:4-carboxymuconolactone decarboxylase